MKDPADRRKWVLDHTAGRGADIVIQVANAMAVPEGLRLLRAGGQYLNIGGGGQATIDVNAMPRQMTYHSILTAEPRHWLQAIQFLAARQKVYPIEEIISASYTLDQVRGHAGHGVVPHHQSGDLPANQTDGEPRIETGTPGGRSLAGGPLRARIAIDPLGVRQVTVGY